MADDLTASAYLTTKHLAVFAWLVAVFTWLAEGTWRIARYLPKHRLNAVLDWLYPSYLIALILQLEFQQHLALVTENRV